MLQEAGLGDPSASWTFHDYEEISERMTQGPIDARTAFGTVRASRRAVGLFIHRSGDTRRQGRPDTQVYHQWVVHQQGFQAQGRRLGRRRTR